MSLLPKKRYNELEANLNSLVNPEKLDSKDKKYVASIEKSLANFDSSVEWADYISFLTRLLKALQSHSKSHWIPHSIQISKCIAKCVSSTLPSGVHRKALEVYECIFKILGQALLAQQINLWIPGLLPLMSYASISVKPSLINLLENHILELPPNYLKVITKVLLLSLLPGIDDESSESFDAALHLIEKLQKKLNDDSHFWQCFFMTIITCPDRRLGALIWSNKNLPNFGNIDGKLSVEAESVISQETGLLLRAFCKSLEDENILVQRGFFDLMISRVKLNSPLLVERSTKSDVEQLIMSACLTVLRKDMSLNRRLWNWLLGTDDSISTPLLDISESVQNNSNPDNNYLSAGDEPLSSQQRMMIRIRYFIEFGQLTLVSGFLKLINSNFLEDRIKGYKVSLAFMDKWEIGLLITSHIFVPFLRSVQRSSNESSELSKDARISKFDSLVPIDQTSNGAVTDEISARKEQYDELFKSASVFFDTVESHSIWSTCFQLIDEANDSSTLNDNLKLILFIITSFNVNEEDMLLNHLPLILISLLVLKLKSYEKKVDDQILFEIVKEILDMVPNEIFQDEINENDIRYFDGIFTIEGLNKNEALFENSMTEYFSHIYDKIRRFYQNKRSKDLSNSKIDASAEDQKPNNIDNESTRDVFNVLDSSLESVNQDFNEEMDQSAFIPRKQKGISVFVLFTFILCNSLRLPQENNFFYTYSKFYSEILEKFPVENSLLSEWNNKLLKKLLIDKAHELINVGKQKHIDVMSLDFDRELLLDFYSLGLSENLPISDKIKPESHSSLRERPPVKFADESYVSIAFGISNLYSKFAKSYSKPSDKISLLKLTLELLYNVLLLPSNKYQVEATSFLLNLELSSQPEYIESGISSIFTKLQRHNEFEKIMKVVKILWTQTSASSSDTIMRRPLFMLLDELNYHNSNYLAITDWLNGLLESDNSNRLFNLIATPLLEFQFLFDERLELAEDFEVFSYYLETIVNVFKVNEVKVADGLANEISQIDQNLLSVLQQQGGNVSTYKSLIVYSAIRFLSLKSENYKFIESAGWEVFESEAFNKATLSGLKVLSLLLDASEPNINTITTRIVELSYQNLRINSIKRITTNSTMDQLISIKYFELISTLIHKSHHKNRKVSIFKINLESPIRAESETHNKSKLKLNYIEYLVYSLGYIRHMLVFKFWVKLLMDNLLSLSDCIFQVLIPLTETICSKITRFFEIIKNQIGTSDGQYASPNSVRSLSADIDDVDQAITFLMSGLEELLNYSHMYLSASEAKPRTSSKLANSDPGFLSSVMSGVFSVESPNNVSFEDSNRFTVLLSFESAARACFKIWQWAEEKTNLRKFGANLKSDSASIITASNLNGLNAGNKSKHFETLDFSKSVEYIASKVKFKSRKLLEKLYQSEPLEILHTLMVCDPKFSSALFKVLHVLDNSRPQLTIPHIFESIQIKLNPDAAKNNFKSSFSNKFPDKKLGFFLVEYLKSLDIGVIEDIYGESITFLKEVNSAPLTYRVVLPSILRFVSILTDKISKVKFGEQRKVRKEICDYYIKVLSFTLSSRGVLNSKMDLPTSLQDGSGSIISGHSVPGGDYRAEDLPEKALLSASNDVNGSASHNNLISGSEKEVEADNVITREDLCASLTSIIPEVNNSVLEEGERSVSIITSIILNVIQPILKAKKISELPLYVLKLILAISELPSSTGNKVWRTLVYDIFTNANFFSLNVKNSVEKDSWSKIISQWIYDDKDKITELIAKVQPSANNSATLFNWSEGETSSKVLKLKRITYLLLISPKDTYLNLLHDLMNKLFEICSSSKVELKSQVFLCLRALVLKFSETHLNLYWTSIYSELESIFANFLIEAMNLEQKKSIKSISLVDVTNTTLLLSASKLLDLLLTLGFEDFNLDEWIFIDDSIEAISGSAGSQSNDKSLKHAPIMFGLIDKISRLKSYKLPKANDNRKVTISLDSPSGGNQSSREKLPILWGYQALDNIELLKPFFDLLSYYNFERVYQMKKPNIKECENDVFNDLFYTQS